ncbi:MAG: hypothetical protein ABSG60_00360 [Terracidiphilus sp.]|jgi:hypothetical protein
MVIDSIYLNRRNSGETKDWVYYRITSEGGKDRDPVTVCRVEWPTFKDIDKIWDENAAIVTTPGVTGYIPAYEQTCALMKNRWDVDHETSALIGFLSR